MALLAVVLTPLAGSTALAQPPAAPAPPAAHVPAPPPAYPDTYLALREVAFSTKPEDVEIQAKPGVEQVYGVIVEFHASGGTSTVVAFGSGDASIYRSNGGGKIGGRREPVVADAARALVALAQIQLTDLPKVTQYPPPAPDHVTVYLLTTAGLRGVEKDQIDIAAADDRLNPLYAGAQQIVSAFSGAPS
ncbi:MAG TPA: hypothetical protein VFE18_13570 [Phenylobacterium sp.]|uniref:hypothetical protein n=1 Tax=Phenylobacterium sp. TaxID=1871053 RepID=UPI002D3069DA|nr:hypothetical protein [Phenylobacterium sp.]HZZ69196.1 hypothetical protein [Phenylobacterium sp.]